MLISHDPQFHHRIETTQAIIFNFPVNDILFVLRFYLHTGEVFEVAAVSHSPTADLFWGLSPQKLQAFATHFVLQISGVPAAFLRVFLE